MWLFPVCCELVCFVVLSEDVCCVLRVWCCELFVCVVGVVCCVVFSLAFAVCAMLCVAVCRMLSVGVGCCLRCVAEC